MNCLLMFFTSLLIAQPPCTSPGQTPSTAFAICGGTTYSQSPLPDCYNSNFFVPGCTNENTSYGDKNPVYFTFTCRSAGSFGFVIMPWKPSDDYNWQLFDITGKKPDAIFTDKSLSIVGNWSGSLGPTGASSTGVNFTQCRSFPVFGETNTFSIMPQLITGNTYLLMVGSIDASGSFAITVGGGTADITDNINQTINASVSSCSSNEVTVKFSKKIRCSSIAGDGSDFHLVPALSTIIAAKGISCINNSETDSIRISFSAPLPNGSYTLSIKNGADNNTLSDACRNFISAGTELKLKVAPFASVDTIIAGCNPDQLDIFFTKDIRCNSIAPDGSDFIISGPNPVTISSVRFNCSGANTNSVTLILQQAIKKGGNYNVTVKTGTDGNTFMSACNDLTPAGTSYILRIKDAVSAGFTYTVKEGCIADTVLFNHPGGNDINSWNWNFQTSISNIQQPTVLYSTGGDQTATLIVSNGSCSDTLQQNFVLKPKLKIDFSAPEIGCTGELVTFINKTLNATTWLWDFSNGVTSSLENPVPQLYPASLTDKTYSITLTAGNSNCSFTQRKNILIKSNCLIRVPTAFTPNDDGLNDVFGPINTWLAGNMVFKVFNRYGQPVFIYSVSNTAWNGKLNGKLQPPGKYIWVLSFTNQNTGAHITKTGTVLLIR
jgi:gliding motility-associated-like protein